MFCIIIDNEYITQFEINSQLNDYIPFLLKGTLGEQSENTSTNEDNINNSDDASSNAGLIVIVVLILILIAAALLLVGLHFKRKLPESFYNLGGLIKGDKQWKPVLAKVNN